MKTVITFGTFDVFHVGHINLLQRASMHGDQLFVGVSTDKLNFSKKGRNPVYNQNDRMKIINSLRYVNLCFLHIGPPKSGTSAIQYALHNNRELLRANGVQYPEHEIGSNGISSGNLTSILSVDEGGKWYVCEVKLHDLIKSFENSESHTLLLSSEYFFYLVQDIATKMPSAQFIAYVRCPLDTFESSYNQSVKRHGRTESAIFSQNLHTTTLNILNDMINVVGRKRFILRAYLPTGDTEFDLVEDFACSCNLPLPKLGKTVTNSSYTFEALEFKRWLNQFKLLDFESSIDQALQAYQKGTPTFSFLPEALSVRYQKQALHTVRDFVQNHKVANGRRLIQYLKNRPLVECKEQSLSNAQLTEIGGYLAEYYPVLFNNILQNLKKANIKSIECRDRVALLDSVRTKKYSLLSKLKTIFLRKN